MEKNDDEEETGQKDDQISSQTIFRILVLENYAALQGH